MGYGKYSLDTRELRASALGYKTKTAREIFKESHINGEMDPTKVEIRESRDSDEHPDSLSIIIALDHTKSMGIVPHQLVKNGLPNMMGKIMEMGVRDPQILFLGIGDHRVDSAPLQIGQFESNDELMDKWLTNVYLEGGGGGNGGESYLLVWYFASRNTSIDCFEKRNKKGILFTIGDEPTHRSISDKDIRRIMGKVYKKETSKPVSFDGEDWNWEEDDPTTNNDDNTNNVMSAESLLEEVKEKYDVYHIHIHQTKQGKLDKNIDSWRELLGDHLLIAETTDDVPNLISGIICN